jgi:putative peptidoglycan lipid II flippase
VHEANATIDLPDPVVPVPSHRRTLVTSAVWVGIGNLVSSAMGLVRQSAVAALGPSIAGPFTAALKPLQTFLDLLANGSVSGALIPTFTDFSADTQRRELRRVVYTVVNTLLILTCTVAVLFVLIAPWLVSIVLTAGFAPAEKQLTVQLAQVMILALMVMGPFAVLQAALYSRRRFGAPAMAAGFLHVGIIAGAIVTGLWGGTHLGRLGLAFGVIAGAFLQLGVLIPTLRRQGLPYQLVLDLSHPAIRRIARLYLPLIPSYIGSMGLVFLDLSLQSRTPGNRAVNVAALSFATTLIQFPAGLVASALSFAILPLLARAATERDETRFKETLLQGVRLGLLLMIPAAAGLIVLRSPITAVLFAHRRFSPQDAALTGVVLQNYAYQLPFIVVDQLVLFAFYARKNTVVPVIVGFVSYLFYGAVAFPFYRTIGAPALAFANTLQNSMHGVILVILFYRFFGALNLRGTVPVLFKILAATAAMVAAALILEHAMTAVPIFTLHTFRGQLLVTAVTGGAAAVVYFACLGALRVEELELLKRAMLAKLGRRPSE